VREDASGRHATVRIGNGGQQTVLAGVSVGFYAGDPTAGGTLLGIRQVHGLVDEEPA
jgi:hypothetical protein